MGELQLTPCAARAPQYRLSGDYDTSPLPERDRPPARGGCGQSAQTLMQQGYAIVGVIFDLTQAADPYTFLGER